ncbi:hypothetical protein B0H14DRAFT_2583586 [Mycena olivaceomarginata]|nr:hypothetical protein B0H14DRAFT_2583586 [Mycena olivaceomarginata]
MPYEEGPLHDLLVDPDGVLFPDSGAPTLSLCTTCHSCLKHNKLPPLSLANRNFLGPVLEELKNLTVIGTVGWFQFKPTHRVLSEEWFKTCRLNQFEPSILVQTINTVVNEPHTLGDGGKAEGWIWQNGYYMSLSAAKEAEYVLDYRAQLHRAHTDMEQWQEVEILGRGFHHPVQEFHKMETV